MYFLITILLASTCFMGDHLLMIIENNLLRAIIDNVTHSAAAVFSWLIVVLKCHKKSSMIVNSVFELFLCGFIASVIDVDHFLLAKSFKLKNAVNLGKKRPILHCTTVPVLLLIMCLTLAWIWDSPRLSRFGWLSWISLFSHHLRDSSRRGIWLWPFGSSSPLPHYLYMLLMLSLPYLIMIPLSEHKTKPLSPHEYITV